MADYNSIGPDENREGANGEQEAPVSPRSESGDRELISSSSSVPGDPAAPVLADTAAQDNTGIPAGDTIGETEETAATSQAVNIPEEVEQPDYTPSTAHSDDTPRGAAAAQASDPDRETDYPLAGPEAPDWQVKQPERSGPAEEAPHADETGWTRSAIESAWDDEPARDETRRTAYDWEKAGPATGSPARRTPTWQSTNRPPAGRPTQGPSQASGQGPHSHRPYSQAPRSDYGGAPNQGQGGWQYGREGRYPSGQAPNSYQPGNPYTGYQPYPKPQYPPQTPQQASYRPDSYNWNFADYQLPTMGRRKVKGAQAFGIFLAVMAMLALIMFAAYGAYALFSGNGTGAPPPVISDGDYPYLNLRDKPDSEGSSSLADGELTTSEIAAKVRPSVVGIAAYTNARSLTPTNEGSGIIMNADGYIITNAHVVENAAAVSVILANGDTYSGTVVGSDKRTDIAIIKIRADALTFAEFGNSEQLMVGEKAVAIGNPGGTVLAGTVTQGCISAVNRPLKSDGVTLYYIQTDAAINPGNSGGPLVNGYGQVIGINSSKIIATGYEGIGFAIPINDAKPIIDQIIQNGFVTRAVIGIVGEEVRATADQEGQPRGILVRSIREDADIASKDVREGDVITHIDDVEVLTFDNVNSLLVTKKPGDAVTLTLFRAQEGRDDQILEVTILLAEDMGA